MERWLIDWREPEAALDQDHSERYTAMTCRTVNAGAEKAYLHIVQQIQPYATDS